MREHMNRKKDYKVPPQSHAAPHVLTTWRAWWQEIDSSYFIIERGFFLGYI